MISCGLRDMRGDILLCFVGHMCMLFAPKIASEISVYVYGAGDESGTAV